MIKIKVGEFVKEHRNNIVEYCRNNAEEISNLGTHRFGLSYPFLALVNTISPGRQRYWKDEYDINGQKYRFCSEFGGSRTDSDNKTLSEKHGNAFLEYLNSKNLLDDKYKGQNIEFIVNKSFSEDELKCYEKIAIKYKLRSHCSSGKKYFQIYPKNVPKNEGSGGCHYEFEIQRNQNILLVLHFENQIKFKKQLKNKITNLFEDKKIPRIDITNFTCEKLEDTFKNLYEKVEVSINEFYLEENNNYWLISSNPEQYDAVSAFKKLNIVDWGNASNNKIYEGDVVYIYFSKPIQAIGIKAKVIKVDFDKSELLNNDQDYLKSTIRDKKNYFRLELIGFTDQEKLSFEDLEKHGINGNIQGKQKIKTELLKYILENETLRLKDMGEKEMKQKSQNKILYGPPGTGKTYNTINKALEVIFEIDTKGKSKKDIEDELVNSADEVIDNKDNDIELDLRKEDERREKLKKVFDFFNEQGQIKFVTFHQSYGYEEFVEGIKAKTGDKGIEYSVEPGIFKKLCTKAQTRNIINITIDSNPQELTKELFRDLYQNFTNDLIDKELNDESNCSLKTKTNLEFDLFKNSTPSIVVKSGKDRTSQSVSCNELEKVLFENKNPTYKSYEQIIIDKILESFNSQTDIVNNSNKNYILIIDEINRGNISKIFGELITLIEPSKRIGAEEEIMLKLPNSSEPFGVPSNLYIIGTMNTADRSIAPIDTALRRRFEFIEMPPKPEMLNENIEGINLQELLAAINTRIEYIYDRDHTIGHSYLLNIENLADLKLSFKNNILPLLAEYFYEDWRNIKIVLNEENIDGFIQSKKTNQYLPTNKNGKVLYEFKDIDNLSENDFKRIYGEDTKVVTNEQESPK